ncbi:patatin-like phospholipase family protein [Planktothrix sp. FACHB-1355]|uniref:Patatin-like phospholipase family protein n=1 Tax=Aerosakkonema funiforme FACHB-1375 TaxID=2949571 RepID=A0A926VBH4_9CYAN|nr:MULTISPECIES: patatin-like phospholipase family protein [Oscillatoriales]MBD2180811.1 patatin-like phospholipase family protein [Aerosakkonema funiforme FACHB-1375]MBD3562102.1 patatin-like phospholipase family protein [Planktothrix sp. FACHB-1355]
MTFRILSLDGGGMRGVISARILKEVESQLQERKGLALHEYFDMIAGTSTGSILTAGIGTKNTSDRLIQLYQDKAGTIFPYQQTNLKEYLPESLHSWVFPLEVVQQLINTFAPAKYSHAGLISSLQDVLGEVEIGKIEDNIILILAYDTLYRNTTFFTNCHPDIGDRWYDDTPLWEICVCSSSAPTFFPAYELKPRNKEKYGDKWSFPHIDGGVGANNPSLAALSLVLRINQALKNSQEQGKPLPKELPPKMKEKLENVKFEDISILSIGTGRTGEPYRYEEVKNWKTLNWAQHIVDVFMEPTSEVDTTICQQIMGGFNSKRYLRLQFDLNERFKAKDPNNESYKDVREIVPEKDRKNRFTGKKISEAIDDSRKQIINDLLATATEFIEQGLTSYARVGGDSQPVKKAIASFIDSN